MPATRPTFPGTFVTTWTAWGISENLLIEPKKFLWFTLPRPRIWIPQSTIAEFRLNADQSIKGKIQRNFGGLAPPGSPPLLFGGGFRYQLNEELDVWEGEINVEIQGPSGGIARTQVLYVVWKDPDTILYMLRESLTYPGQTPLPVTADATVQGVLERVR